MSELPKGWTMSQVGTIAEVRLGKMLSPKAYDAALRQRLYLRNENVRWGHIDFSDVKSMGFKESERERYAVEPGDLLVCEGGEPGRAAVFRGPRGRYMYQKALHRLRPNLAATSAAFLQLFFLHYARSTPTSQTTIAHLPLEKLTGLSIPLPPANEQRRIVEELEKQLTRRDAGVEALKRVQAQLKKYRASVLKAACEGRLVPTEAELARRETRDYEPAAQLLERILKERRSRWEKDQLAKFKAAGKPPKDDNWKAKYESHQVESGTESLPLGWTWATLRQVAELKGGITKGQKRNATDRLRSVAYLRVANVQRGYLDLSEMKEIEATDAEIDELRLQRGDILFNEGGDRDKLGRGWIWRDEIPECIHQNHVFRARVDESLLEPKFISHYANSFGQKYFLEQGKQTTNLASINLTKLGSLPVPLPPLAEQRRIVLEVEDKLSVADAIAAQVERDLERAKRLRQSILSRAFAGQLVPQDPNDEPASKLLERLKAEAPAAAPAKTRGKRQPKRAV